MEWKYYGVGVRLNYDPRRGEWFMQNPCTTPTTKVNEEALK